MKVNINRQDAQNKKPTFKTVIKSHEHRICFVESNKIREANI